jgi:tetratricopeptide (TPR) repeat protein
LTVQAFQFGDTIAERFLVLRYLRGGISDVYLTFDLHPVEYACRALKTLRTTQRWNSDARDSFNRETAAWVSLGKHPNVVRCFTSFDVHEVPYLLLDWVSDENSRTSNVKELIREGPISTDIALQIARDLFCALCHGRDTLGNFVHGDIKPENLLIAENATIKLTDFGLTRTSLLLQQRGKRGDTVRISGTPPYMAPELWEGASPTEQTDIYAIGCLIYEMVEGVPPVSGRTLQSIRLAHLEEEPAPPTLMESRIWDRVRRCMAKDSLLRPHGYEEIAEVFGLTFPGRIDAPHRSVGHNGEFTATDYGNQGIALFIAGEHELALNAFDRAIELDAGLSRAFNNRAKLFVEMERYDDALRDYAKALELDPEFVEVLNNRAQLYLRMGRAELGLADAEKAVQLNGEWPTALSTFGLLLYEAHRFDEALEQVNAAFNLEPKESRHSLVRADIYMALSRYDAALADIDRLRPREDIEPVAHVSLALKRAQCLGRMGLTDVAVAELLRQISRAEVAWSIGEFFLNEDEPALALPCLSHAVGLGATGLEKSIEAAIEKFWLLPVDDIRLMRRNTYRRWSDEAEHMLDLLTERLEAKIGRLDLQSVLDYISNGDPTTALTNFPILRDPEFYAACEEIVFPCLNTLRGEAMILQFAILERLAL